MARAGLDVFDTDSIGLMQIMMEYTPMGDKVFLCLGSVAAVVFGACFPAFFYYFGQCVDEMGLATSAFNYDP